MTVFASPVTFKKIHTALFSALLLVFICSSSTFASFKSTDLVRIHETTSKNIVPVIKISGKDYSLTNEKAGKENRGATYLTTRDVVPHASITMVSSLTFAVLIALINNDPPTQPVYEGEVPGQIAFHKILFRSIISTNAP